MTAQGDTAAIVLAAGAASRFGAAKLVVLLDGEPLVRRAACAARAATSVVAVVTGAHREGVAAAIARLDVIVAHNTHWQSGLGSSIACGLRALLAQSTRLRRVAILLADQALLGAVDLARLLSEHDESPDSIVAAGYDGTCGAPCVFPQAYFAQLCQLRAANGARALLKRHAQNVRVVPLARAAVDIDTQADYAALIGDSTRN